MSKTIKRKITVELSKPRELSKSRLSVFQRLGSKKQKSIAISEGKSITKTLKQTLSAAVNINTTSVSINSAVKSDNVELEDVDPDMLEKKRAEIQKELELQLRMESRKAAAKESALRKRKRVRSSSSSSSSSSASGSSSSSSTSSSSHTSDLKLRKSGRGKRCDSSSSSDDGRSKKKKRCHAKKEAHAKLQKISHSTKKLHVRSSSSKSKKRSMSPSSLKKQRLLSGQKVILKSSKSSMEKHLRLREKEKERERQRELQLREREREKEREERERLRLREKGLGRSRSRSQKLQPKSRSPKRLSRSRDLLKKSPRRPSPAKSRLSATSSVRSVPRRHDSRERERRDKERLDREALREKERDEALARCQERQRERERIAAAKEKRSRLEEEDRQIDRLLPRPAERAMALAAARDRNRDSPERDRHLLSSSHAGRVLETDHVTAYSRAFVDREDDLRPYDHRDRRLEKEHGRDFRRHDEDALRDVARVYDDQPYDDHLRRDDRRGEYTSRAAYDERHRIDRDREWTRDELAARDLVRDNYDRSIDRHQQQRDWDRGHSDIAHSDVRERYDTREWAAMNEKGGKQWESRDRDKSTWPQEDNWDHYNDDKWAEPGRSHTDKVADHNLAGGANSGAAGLGSSGVGGGRRWANWRARRANHHNEYRRHEIFEERGEIYRRHINPQGNNSNNSNNNNSTTSTANNSTITSGTTANTSTIAATANSSNSSSTNVDQPKPASPPPVRPSITQQKSPEPQPIKAEEVASKPDEPKDDTANEADGEEIADDLSEISDEADDILNRQEDECPLSPIAKHDLKCILSHNTNGSSICEFGSPLQGKDVEEQLEKNRLESTPPEINAINESADKPLEDVAKISETLPVASKPDDPPAKELADEIDLDFEEISDGELEEEARIRGLGDALGVDWASLVEESKSLAREKSKDVQSSARQRWQPHRILLDTGISFKMAGELFARKVLQEAHIKLVEEIDEEQKGKIANINGNSVNDTMQMDASTVTPVDMIKREDGNHFANVIKDEIKDIFNLELHPLACVQVGTRLEATKRQQLVFNAVGPFSRALCAKRDIAMRRQLCGLPIKENNCKLTVAKPSSGYELLAAKIFQKALGQSN